MSTSLHNAATWPRSVRQHIEAIAATLMLGLQVFRERAMNLGGSLAANASSDAKDEKIRRLEVELDLHRRRFRAHFNCVKTDTRNAGSSSGIRVGRKSRAVIRGAAREHRSFVHRTFATAP